jgi:hypothetical protein
MITQEDKIKAIEMKEKMKHGKSKLAVFFRRIYIMLYIPIRHFFWPYECGWSVDGCACNGRVKLPYLFDHQLRIPVCAKHFHQHKCVTFLIEQGQDTEEMLAKDVDLIEQEAQTLAAEKNINIDKDVKP